MGCAVRVRRQKGQTYWVEVRMHIFDLGRDRYVAMGWDWKGEGAVGSGLVRKDRGV